MGFQKIAVDLSMKVHRNHNEIIFPEKLHLTDIDDAISCLYQAITKMGYPDVILNFRSTVMSAPEFMLALCDNIYGYRENGVGFSIIMPDNENHCRLYKNTNWAHYLNPTQFSKSNFRGHSQVPATLFCKPEEQFHAVNSIVKVILSSIEGIDRGDFAAFEWAINEITDNVLVHTKPSRGFVQVSKFHKGNKKISFVVCDSGGGIPKTLRESLPIITSDPDALTEAIKEGVTRDKSIGQGNGLFGSYQICTESGGEFKIRSGHAILEASKSSMRTNVIKIPYKGTIIVSEIDFSMPKVLEKALKFGGEVHKPWTRIEKQYEDENDDLLIIFIKEEAKSFGSRPAGTPVRKTIKNLMHMHPGHKVQVNFEGVEIISSSFADEVFGKLVMQISIEEYQKRIQVKNVNETIVSLIDKAISQRIFDVKNQQSIKKT